MDGLREVENVHILESNGKVDCMSVQHFITREKLDCLRRNRGREREEEEGRRREGRRREGRRREGRKEGNMNI